MSNLQVRSPDDYMEKNDEHMTFLPSVANESFQQPVFSFHRPQFWKVQSDVSISP